MLVRAAWLQDLSTVSPVHEEPVMSVPCLGLSLRNSSELWRRSVDDADDDESALTMMMLAAEHAAGRRGWGGCRAKKKGAEYNRRIPSAAADAAAAVVCGDISRCVGVAARAASKQEKKNTMFYTYVSYECAAGS